MSEERNGTPWEKWEVNMLRQFVHLGWNNKQIAEAFKRSQSAVSAKMAREGIQRDEAAGLRLMCKGLEVGRRMRGRGKKGKRAVTDCDTVSLDDDGITMI